MPIASASSPLVGSRPEPAAQPALGIAEFPPALATRRAKGGKPAKLVDHRAADADLGIGREAVRIVSAVALRAFGQRDEPGLDEVFGFHPGLGKPMQVPGELAHHRREAFDDHGR